MSSSSSSSFPIASTVFDIGSHIVNSMTIDSSPRPLLIFTPSEAGFFPVLIFLHGFLLYNSFYSQLLHHVASHGFIVVAPQLYSLAGPDASQEVAVTAEITKWMFKELSVFLPLNVKPNMGKLALSGHSRGGKVAFALALSRFCSSCPKFSALIGVDPVDGMDKGNQTPPPVLTYVPKSFKLNGTAVMIIGSGLGEERRNPLFPACAPKGVNHENFYNECSKPAYYFVGKDYGHLDVLDDETNGIRGKTSYCLCKNGVSRGPMRRFVGGVLVAFLKAYLSGNSDDLVAIRQGLTSTQNFKFSTQKISELYSIHMQLLPLSHNIPLPEISLTFIIKPT